MTTSSQQNSKQGLTLSAADIQALLKDPHSWVSKLYNDCLLMTAITEAQFIQLAHCVIREQKLLAKELASKELAHAEHDTEKATRYYQELYALVQPDKTAPQETLSSSLTVNPLALKLEMAALIALPQANMTPIQLTAQYQQITKNLNNQVAARLGSSITVSVKTNGINTPVPITLAIPSISARSAASAVDLVKLSPALGTRLADKGIRAGFAKHVADAGIGHLAVINKWKEIVLHNPDAFKEAGIDPDNMNLSPSMLKAIDKAYQSCLNENNDLRECLQKNNEYALDAAFNGITNEMGNTHHLSPALFPLKPSPNSLKTTETDEEPTAPYSNKPTK